MSKNKRESKSNKRIIKPKYTYLTQYQVDSINLARFIKKLSIRVVAEKMNIGYPTLCNKINGREEFRQTEIFALSEILDIPLTEIPVYFFDVTLRSVSNL
jgi:hypothetical protein